MASERTSVDESPAKWAADRHTLICLSFLGVICVMVAIDATILVPALPTIAEALHGTAAETFWAGSSYLLTNATFQPLIATLSSVVGRRRMLLLSIVLFTVGSLVSSLANNFPTLLAGRTIKGIGGGGIMALNLVIITDMIPLRFRPKYYVFTQLAWAVGTITGPLIGGAIAEYADWRILFYINFPFCAVGLVAVVMVPKVGNPGQWSLDAFLHRVDWTGNLLFMAGSTAFLIGITWAGHQYPWDSAQVLVPLIIGLALIGATIAWEYLAAGFPFFRRTMLRNRALMTTYFCTMIAGFLMYAHLYYVALFMMSVQSRTALMTGVSVLPIFVGFMPASGLVGAVVQRRGKWKWSLWLGWAINTLGAGLFLLLDKNTHVAAWVFIFLACGFGQGALISAHNIGVQAIADPDDVAWASAIFTFIRSVGLCLGVALGGTVLQTQLVRELDERGLPAEIAEHAESFIFQLAKMPDDSRKAAIIDAFSDAFNFLFIILVAISGATMLLSFTVRGYGSIHRADSDELMGPERGMDMEAAPEASGTDARETKP